MTPLPPISGKECVKVLQRMGFYIKRQHGSHIIMRIDNPFHQVVVPDHSTLDRGTLRAILKQANITVDDFVTHL